MHKISNLPFPVLSRENSVKHHLFRSPYLQINFTLEFSVTLGAVWHYFCSSCANRIYLYWNVLSFRNEMQSTEEPITTRMHLYWIILFMEIQLLLVLSVESLACYLVREMNLFNSLSFIELQFKKAVFSNGKFYPYTSFICLILNPVLQLRNWKTTKLQETIK